MSKQSVFIVSFALFCVVVFGGIALTRNIGRSEKDISIENATEKINKMYDHVRPQTKQPIKSSVEFDGGMEAADELPPIESCEITAHATTGSFAEIWSSPEKAGSGTDAWLVEMAEKYNKERHEIDGNAVSVQIRKVNSGQAVDYIATEKATPDAFSPSSIIWKSILEAKGKKSEVISDRMVGNVAGIMLKNSIYDEFIKEYGSVDIKSVTDASIDGKYAFGYTNPFASTAGMNFLITTLERFDGKNPLSETAVEGFKSFQKNVPFVSLTTMQMREAAENGSLDGFIMEYQSYQNDANLSRNYKFTPYGYRHDNPLIACDGIAPLKKEILKDFAAFCEQDSAQKSATKFGFNGLDSYKGESEVPDGNTLMQAQKLYKQNKDNGRAIVAVFIADISGSMDGEPIANLKRGLINSMKYINAENSIGLISYSDDVYINVPIAKFDLNQQSLFKGSVESLSAGGSTATNDAIIVAAKMISGKLAEDPDLKPMIFVLSDGETNRGYSLREIKGVLAGIRYPVYTIGYNANLDALKSISSINEAASINADTDDIIYQMKMLFESNM